MRAETIAAVWIDDGGSLWVKPATATFPYIYREAMEVPWDAERLCLSAPSRASGRTCGGSSRLEMPRASKASSWRSGQTTSWAGIDPELRQAMTDDELSSDGKS